MKKIHLIAATLLASFSFVAQAQDRPDTVWFQFNDRFTENEIIDLTGIDSIEFTTTQMKRYKTIQSTGKATSMSKTYRTNGVYRFDEIERYLVKPRQYSSIDFTNENSKFCFKRSAESEHFVIFWEKGFTKQANGNLIGGASSSTCNVNTLLTNAEKIWKVYVEELGFLEPGNSTTDNVKIEMFVVNQSEWRADGSGERGTVWTAGSGTTTTAKEYQTGLFHCNAWASSDNVTVAHEIGHTFQYLVSADLGSNHGLNYALGENSKGNEWWEDCANWQAHKVYPAQQFTDRNYWGENQKIHHLNILHEDARYKNCYYQDWWCQQHGLNTVARVWRESNRPEDPIKAYMRIFGLNEETFADEQYEGYAHIASMDIDRWKVYGQHLIGSEQQRLKEVPAAIVDEYLEGDNSWWIVDPEYCPQNYGYNANPLKIPAAGTVVKAQFKGIAGADGYRAINIDRAGWRYGLVAYSSDGTRTYGEMGRGAEGEVSITVPENCVNMWFVVMGAPIKYWTHAWNDNVDDDEQWPYAVKFEGTDPLGVSRTYGEFPENYERKDTTVVINANLAYSSSSYSSVRVQYDMDAISQALGVSTAQLKAVKQNVTPSKTNNICFAGISTNGTRNYNKTVTTPGDNVYGHWFTTTGNVCNYDSSAAVFTEFYPDKYGCYVGQYPGRLKAGSTYVIRQAIVYTHTDGKQYTATMEVHLNVK
ncbi:MAG: DUF4859 domain-containing protein [Prevotellaceae bacterium]|nr:DUF4859 domain-containing protein [Prevotellaceae bacterium]